MVWSLTNPPLASVLPSASVMRQAVPEVVVPALRDTVAVSVPVPPLPPLPGIAGL